MDWFLVAFWLAYALAICGWWMHRRWHVRTFGTLPGIRPDWAALEAEGGARWAKIQKWAGR